MNRALQTFIGACVVSAACSASPAIESALDPSAGADMPPVRDALAGLPDAATPPPDIATEPCDKISQVNGSMVAYAEHLYPGKRAQELGGVRLVVHYTISVSPGYGYAYSQADAMLKDGAAAFPCGMVGSTPIDSVTFTLPR